MGLSYSERPIAGTAGKCGGQGKANDREERLESPAHGITSLGRWTRETWCGLLSGQRAAGGTTCLVPCPSARFQPGYRSVRAFSRRDLRMAGPGPSAP